MNLDPIYQEVKAHQNIFRVIGIYQSKKLKEDLVYSIMDLLEKNEGGESEKKTQKNP